MKNVSWILIILLGLLVFAAMSNPSKEQFLTWSLDQVKENAETEFEKLLGNTIARPLLDLTTTREDKVFYSIYSVEKTDTTIKYLGIFNNFYKLKDTNS